jgi:hypothetical protein
VGGIFTLDWVGTIAEVPGVGKGVVARVDGIGGKVGWCAFCDFGCTRELGNRGGEVVDGDSEGVGGGCPGVVGDGQVCRVSAVLGVNVGWVEDTCY